MEMGDVALVKGVVDNVTWVGGLVCGESKPSLSAVCPPPKQPSLLSSVPGPLTTTAAHTGADGLPRRRPGGRRPPRPRAEQGLWGVALPPPRVPAGLSGEEAALAPIRLPAAAASGAGVIGAAANPVAAAVAAAGAWAKGTRRAGQHAAVGGDSAAFRAWSKKQGAAVCDGGAGGQRGGTLRLWPTYVW